MKYKVGDLLLVKKCEYKPLPLPLPRLRSLLRLRPRLHPRLRLHNTIGIITKIEKHTDIFESGSTEDDNAYIWYSQADNKEYYFYQDEIDGEVVR